MIFKDNLNQLDTQFINFKSIFISLFLVILSMFSYGLFSKAWVMLLEKKYPNFKLKIAFQIIGMSQIAKYLPGNVAHIVGRFYLSKKLLSSTDITTTLLIETILFTGTSFLIGCGYIIYSDIYSVIPKSDLIIVFTVFSSIVLATYLGLKILNKNYDTSYINTQSIFKSLFIYLLLPIIGGLTIYVIFNCILQSTPLPFLLCASAFSLSFLAGFIVPGAPGGIGVREYIFTILLTPFVAPILALQAILIFRLISLMSDVVLFFISKSSTHATTRQT